MDEIVLNEALHLIAGYCKGRREELGLSYSELSERTGLPIKTVQGFDKGELWVGFREFLMMCEALSLFPLVSTYEGSDSMSRDLRESWTRKQEKDMSIEEALRLKSSRNIRPDSDN